MRNKHNLKKLRITNEKFIITSLKVKCIITWFNPITGLKQHSTGVSKRNPEDEYNQDKGKHLAESRAKYAMYKRYIAMLHDETAKAVIKTENLAIHENLHIKNIINDIKD